ncbi:hypothetical protein HU200_019501 [Digitaria exilis]|uniref:Uncharacterized protein n=1 Tax=Digitaria exilis TaxID=1010633 RepID=A0A835F3F8_9POAL|nr:hypothetical protein HU200_019501 [Digitaria exilis]CAB3460418.1 unnamed protein product [Digitaria exilis]
MDKKSSATAPLAAACVSDDAIAHAKSPEQEAAEQAVSSLQSACAACLSVSAAVLVAYSFVATAWRARNDPGDLAFVAGAAALLAALLACLRRAERLTPDSPAEERRRVQAAVWLLSTVLSCAFAYRVAAIMPMAVAVLVWCMTALVVLVGFCLLVLCKDEQYQCLEEVEDAGDAKLLKNKIKPNDELV